MGVVMVTSECCHGYKSVVISRFARAIKHVLIFAQKRNGSTSAIKMSAVTVIPISMLAFLLKSSMLFNIALPNMFCTVFSCSLYKLITEK